MGMIGLARVIEVKFILRLSFLSNHLYKPLSAGIVTWFCIMSIRSFIMGYHTLVTLSIVFLCSILVYGFVLWILKLEPEDKDFWFGLVMLKSRQEIDLEN